jgi:hypothetical protein
MMLRTSKDLGAFVFAEILRGTEHVETMEI